MSVKKMSNIIAQHRQELDDQRLMLKKISKDRSERGSSLIITLLVMFLLLGFVALTLSRSANESAVSSNDQSEARAFEAAQAGLEDATRDFASVMETKLSPTTSDINHIKNDDVYGFTDKFTITKNPVLITNSSRVVTIDEGPFQGLIKLQDEYQITVSAKEKNSDVQVDLMRRFYNNRIPLFQFGAFYNDDLELNRPPLFTFGGRVHTNSNFFVTANSPNAGIYFSEKATAAGEIINDIWKTGTTLSSNDNAGQVFFRNALLQNVELKPGEGSVTCTSATGGGVLKSIGGRGRAYPYPTCQLNPNWSSISAHFDGNLTARTKELRLPVDQLTNADGTKVDLIEMMRRGKNLKDKVGNGTINPADVTTAKVDDPVLSKERYANKPGIRISLADSQNELPQCVGVAVCGVQLDAPLDATKPNESLGYKPLPMTDGATYKTTAVNGNRLKVNGRQTWIKVELVSYDSDNNIPIATDVTQDFLSLGMTEPVDTNDMTLSPYQTASGTSPQQDSRSIIKIQQFYTEGNFIPNDNNYLTNKTIDGVNYNFVVRTNIDLPTNLIQKPLCIAGLNLPVPITTSCIETAKNVYAAPVTDAGPSVFSGNSTEDAHFKIMKPVDNSVTYKIVPFPIEMYDSREGNRQDSSSGISGNNVFRNGVMSLIDVDVKNLKRFFDGEFDGKFPTTTPFATANLNIGLKSSNVPENRGWVMYFSDRRGDNDFDGRYDMEKVSPFSTASLVDQDLDNNGLLDTDFSTSGAGGYNGEAPALDNQVDPGWAAVTDHAYYRRGVRLINGRQLPGKYDKNSPETTQGFTFASENGIYVSGNYNVESVTLSGTNAPALSSNYFPQGSSSLLQVPASIVGDSITVLSNGWNDSASFTTAFDSTKRVASNTQLRFAMISGDSLTARTVLTNGNFDGLNGGIHNFLRFLETWNGKRLNYTGSLINLFNSFNNNGRWKCCTTVYSPPTRDWTFDDSFKDPNRLPPGSPFVYSLTLTGFQRINE